MVYLYTKTLENVCIKYINKLFQVVLKIENISLCKFKGMIEREIIVINIKVCCILNNYAIFY